MPAIVMEEKQLHPTNVRKPAKAEWPVYLVPVLLALIFRLPVFLFNDSLRLDEGFSMRFIQADFWGILQQAANDSHSPAYTLLLKGWCAIFGTSEFAARSLSLLFGVAAVIALYELGLQLYGKLAGIMAASLAAISPLWVWYSVEARMYTIWLTFICLNSLFLFRLARQPKTLYMLGYALSGVLVIYTQYIGVLILGLHIGYILLTWKKNRQLIWWVAQSYTIIILLFIPWIMAVAAFYNGFESDKLPPPTLYEAFLLFIQLFFGYITDNAIFRFIQPVLAIFVAGLLLVTLTVLLPAIISTPKVKAYTKVFFVTPFIFFAGFFGLSFLTSVMEVRYLICITPFIYLLMGNLLASAWKRRSVSGVGWAAIVLLIFGWATFTQTTDPANQFRVDYRSAAAYITPLLGSHDQIIVDAYFIEPVFNYYFKNHSTSPLIFGPTSTELIANPDLKARLIPPDTTHIVWVVQSYWERPQSPTLQYYSVKYPLVEYKVFSPELCLWGFWIGGS